MKIYMKGEVINKLEKIQDCLRNIDNLAAEELDKLSYLILREAAAEYRHSRKDFFTMEETKNKLIEYITKYCNNTYSLRNILGVMGFTAIRFDDYDDRYYQFFLANINNPENSINMMIARFFPDFPQFEDFPNKWEYIISIPKIPPKKESITTFYGCVKSRLGHIPAIYKNDIIKVFENYILKNNLHISTKERYEEIINKLREAS
jgi:hypothetical protein